MHKGVQDLKIFHLGGDEIANVWKGSPECISFIEENKRENLTHMPKRLQLIFIFTITKHSTS